MAAPGLLPSSPGCAHASDRPRALPPCRQVRGTPSCPQSLQQGQLLRAHGHFLQLEVQGEVWGRPSSQDAGEMQGVDHSSREEIRPGHPHLIYTIISPWMPGEASLLPAFHR